MRHMLPDNNDQVCLSHTQWNDDRKVGYDRTEKYPTVFYLRNKKLKTKSFVTSATTLIIQCLRRLTLATV